MTPLLSDTPRAISKRMREEKSFNTEFAGDTWKANKMEKGIEKMEEGRLTTKNLTLKTKNCSVVIALLADRKRDGEPVALRRERAGRVGSVGTRGIFKAVEIEHELAGFIEAVGGEAGIEKAAGTVSCRSTGRIAQNEEKLCDGGIFEDGLKPKCFSSESEFRGTGNGLIVGGADESGECDGLVRGIGNPPGGHTISGVGRVPLEFAETDDGGRMRILDAKSEAGLAADHVHVESADGEVGGNFIVVRFGSQRLRFCRRPSDEEVRRESSGGRIQGDGFAFEVKDGEMRGPSGEMDFVAGGRADRIVPGLEPFKAGERKPAVRLEEVRFVFCAPGSGVFLPGGVLCKRRERKDPAGEEEQG